MSWNVCQYSGHCRLLTDSSWGWICQMFPPLTILMITTHSLVEWKLNSICGRCPTAVLLAYSYIYSQVQDLSMRNTILNKVIPTTVLLVLFTKYSGNCLLPLGMHFWSHKGVILKIITTIYYYTTTSTTTVTSSFVGTGHETELAKVIWN